MSSKQKNPPVIYVDDSETTVYEGQTDTKAWAIPTIPLKAPNDPDYVTIYGSIEDYMRMVNNKLKEENQIRYFHNLKFDGCLLLNYLLSHSFWREYGFLTSRGIEHEDDIYKMPDGYFTYTVSDKGQWYTIRIKNHGHYCEFRDSLKLIPLSVREIGEKFNTPHRKKTMEYEGRRYPNCPISPEEEEYIKNDVLVVKEALEQMFDQGLDSLTIGSCCMKEFKKSFDEEKYGKYDEVFPNLYEVFIPEYSTQEAKTGLTPGDWIRKAYKGGWCYVNPEYAGKEVNVRGITADV